MIKSKKIRKKHENAFFVHNKNGDNMIPEPLYEVVYRGLLSLLTLFLITKLIGRRQVSELNFFDYIIGISIGNFAAEITINQDVEFYVGVVAILIYGFIAYILSIITNKSIWIRRLIMGSPIILVEEGKLLEKNLKRTRLDINEFLENCRNSGYFSLDEIEYAILESNGKMSILPKAIYKPVTLKDMNIKASNSGLVANVIIDGKIMKENLKNMNKNQKWLDKELKIKGYKTMDNILLATLDNQEKLTIYERNIGDKGKEVLE